ncbi:hypothetical protein CN488_09915 [Bacillus anthracis]|nr:hypothetical protein CN488_09915 [Bacillus anthracis]PGR29164.1 hypothetical protein COC50_03210 [Bacillus anthracis]
MGRDVARERKGRNDYKQSLREDVKEKKEDLLKFLPKSLHPYIHDNTINSEYPSAK